MTFTLRCRACNYSLDTAVDIKLGDSWCCSVCRTTQYYQPTTNPKQQYGDKKLPVHRVPPAAILAIAKALGEGARKYEPFNWRDLPVETLTYYAGAMRHLLAWFDGEDIDPDSLEGKTHLEGAIGSLAILIDATTGGYAIDNRPSKPGAAPRLLLEGARDAAK